MKDNTGGHIRADEWMGAEALRRARLSAGLSRKEAAEKTGVSLEMWGKMEQGRRKPGLHAARKLHEFFHIPSKALGVK